MKSITWLFLLLLSGCVTKQGYIMVVTSTITGAQIAENPSTQLYEAKFGYSRNEFALCPTSGPPILLEVNYSGILSRNSGIYQRLAVGDKAVQQPGAAILFAKDASGNLSTNVTEAITRKIMAIPEH